tara:strand:- start:634 stop:840 length:207 start_codon:yes stop_codon:yes gene_type:complete
MKKLLEPYNLSIRSSKKILKIFKEKNYIKKEKISFFGEITTKFYILKAVIIMRIKRVNKIYGFYIMDQ